MNLGRICPYIYHDNVKRNDTPQNVLATHYQSTEYEWMFIGSFEDKVHIHPVCRYTEYWKCNNDDPISKTLQDIINGCVYLMEHTEEERVLYHLYLFYDMHVPMMCAIDDGLVPLTALQKFPPSLDQIIHEGSLPDIIHLIPMCSFWNENKTKMKPIVHLLCKSLPQRCQIRNLREIIANYCQSDDTVYVFLLQSLICSLLGNYQHAKKRPNWRARYDLIRRFIYKPPNRNQMQEWIFTYYQNLLFYVIKEFLAFGMRLITPLYEEIKKTYKWEIFESYVSEAMDKVRMTVERNTSRGHGINKWFEDIESILVDVNKHQLGNLYRPQRQSFTQIVLQHCERIDEQRSIVEIRKEFPLEYKHIMLKMAKRLKRCMDVPIHWLQYFGVCQKTIDAFVNMQRHYHQNTFRTELKKRLISLTRYEFEAIRDLFETMLQTHHEIRIFPLPKHLYVKQVKALRRRYGIRNGVSLPEHVGKVYICTSCNTFKGFVVKKGSDANLFANGHHKVLIDDETLKCYCGRRSEKTDSKKRKNVMMKEFVDMPVQSNRMKKKEWKTKRKQKINEICAETECIEFDMTGSLFQFYNNLYLFCPMCANPTVYNPECMNEHGITCGQCMENGVFYMHIICSVCQLYRGKNTWETVDIDFGDKGTKTLPICKQCYKPWIRQQQTPIPVDIFKNKLLQPKKKVFKS